MKNTLPLVFALIGGISPYVSVLRAEEEKIESSSPAEVISAHEIQGTLTLDDIYETTASYLEYIQKNQEASIEEVKKYALLSPYISSSRKEQLIAYLRDLHEWLAERSLSKEGTFSMKVTASKVSGDFATAVIYFLKEDNVTDIGILPVMYIRHDNKWRIAPFVSSFSNSSLIINEQQGRVAKILENWALQQPSQLEQEAVKKGEEALVQKLTKIREEKKANEASPVELLKLWIDAIRSGDVNTVAAISEVMDSSGNTYRARWEEAKQYVKMGHEKGNLPLTSMLQSPSCLVIPYEDKEKDSRRIYLGILDLNSYFPSEDAVYLFTINVGKGYEGKGHKLSLPRTFSARAQTLYRENNSSESVEELNKHIVSLLSHYLETHPRKEFASPEDFSKEYSRVFSSHHISAEAFLSVVDKSSLETVDAFEKVKSVWQDTRSTREYVKRLSNEHKGWREEATFVSKLQPIDENNVLFLMTWYNPLTLPQFYGVHAVVLSKKENQWYWNLSPKDKPSIDGLARDFYNGVKEKAISTQKDWYLYLGKKELPATPEKNLTNEQITMPDDSLNASIQEILKEENAMERYFFRLKGSILLNEEESPITLSSHWKKWERESPESLKEVKREGSENIGEYTGVLYARQHGEWALIGLKLKGKGETQILAQPMVKYKGNWRKISLNNLYTIKGEKGLEARSMPKKNSNPLYDSLDRKIFLPMLKSMIEE